MDDMTRDGKDIHHTNPCEELNYHGRITPNFTTPRPTSQTNHGYPDCHAVWDPSVLPSPLNTQLKTGSVFSTTNAAGDTACAASRQPPTLCFPSHTAPLDIKFNANGTAAYVAFHGSWDKAPPDGFRVSRVAFNPDTGLPVEPLTSTSAALDIMFNGDNGACPNRCFRPVGLAWDKKGRLFMASDSTNEVWVVGGAE